MHKIILVISLLLTGCVLSPEVNISEQVPSSTYTGRGTNAGPMLVGALGATGLAVGLAIDQGIAKDFDKQIQQYKSDYLPKVSAKILKIDEKITHISLRNIKFTGVKGNDDLVNAQVLFDVLNKKNKSFIEVKLVEIDFELLKNSSIFWEELLKKLNKTQI